MLADRDINPRDEFRTRAKRYRRNYRRYLVWGGATAVLMHTVVILFFVAPSNAEFEFEAEEMDVVDIPPEIQIPPPPEEIARPATPVIATSEIEIDVTIAETDIVADQSVPEVSAPAPELTYPEPVEDEEQFVFTPYTVKPKCKSGCTAEAILAKLPPFMKKTGVDCELTVGIRIDTAGQVTNTDLLQPSENHACNQAVAEWALTTSWTTAYNRDMPVVVWIAQPIILRTE